MILLGMVLWLVMAIGAALLTRHLWRDCGPTVGPSIVWALFGAALGALLGILASVPDVDWPWDMGPMLGSGVGALLLSVLYRFVAARTNRTRSARGRVVAAGLLASGTAALLSLAWFALARVNPREYRPEVNPSLDLLQIEEGLSNPAVRQEVLERIVATYLSREENAGVVVGVSLGGDRTVVSGGVASKQTGIPVARNTVFEIGSISKVFAGLALASGVVARDVGLDQEVRTLLLDDSSLTEIATLPSLTLGELATHTAGLPNQPAAMPLWSAVTTDNPFAELSQQDLLASLEAAAPAIPQERAYHYSSFGFTLLSYLLERGTGLDYPSLLAERVFDPLEMTRTRVPIAATSVEGLATGHSKGRSVPHWIGHRWAGAAGVVSTADDLLTLAETHWRGRLELLDEVLALAGTERGQAWGTRKMGLGWHIVDEGEGPRILYHSGSTLGFYAYLGHAPDARVAVVVLANSSDPTAAAIGVRILAALASTPVGAASSGQAH